MARQTLAGWILASASILLLIAFNRLDLLAIVLPAAAALGFAITRHRAKPGLTRSLGKG